MKSIKIDLSFGIKALDGEIIKDADVNKILANILAGGVSKDQAAMAMKLAMEMYKNPVMEVTIQEFRFIENALSEASITNLAKAQIEEYLKTVKL